MKLTNDSVLRTYERQLKNVLATQEMYGLFLVEQVLTPTQIHIYTDRYKDLEGSAALLVRKIRDLKSQMSDEEIKHV